MANFEKYLNEQGKNKTLEKLAMEIFEEGFAEGFEVAAENSADPKDTYLSLSDREQQKISEEKARSMLKDRSFKELKEWVDKNTK